MSDEFQRLADRALESAVKAYKGEPEFDIDGYPASAIAHKAILDTLCKKGAKPDSDDLRNAMSILGTAWICKSQNISPERVDTWLADSTGLTDLIQGSMLAAIDHCDFDFLHDLTVRLLIDPHAEDYSDNSIKLPALVDIAMSDHGATSLQESEIADLEKLRNGLYQEYKKVDDFLRARGVSSSDKSHE